MDKDMRIIFMGTPEFGVPTLVGLVESGYKVVGVFCQVDKAGHRNKVEFGAVKKKAVEYGIDVFQYSKLRSVEGVQAIKELKPDLIVTAAFGQILSQEILDIPSIGVYNVHASLLPKYRGSCPIHWAIIKGEKETGVTIMRTVYALDAGDIILKTSIPIDYNDDYGSMYNKLSLLGKELLIEVLNSQPTYTKQDESGATYDKIITKQDGLIVWNKSANEIDCLIRGVTPKPSAYTMWGDTVVKISKAAIINDDTIINNNNGIGDYDCLGGCGQIVKIDKRGLLVKTGNGIIALQQLQLPSKNKLSAMEFINATKIAVGAVLGERF